MSILLDSTNPIILLSFKAEDFYMNFHLILERASIRALLGYVTGKQILPTEAKIERLNLPMEHFFRQQLKSEQSKAEDKMRVKLMNQIQMNPLRAYMLATPVIALNPLYPTMEELDHSRQVILYHSRTYQRFIEDLGQDLEVEGTPERDRQYNSIRPSPAYRGFESNDVANTQAAENVIEILPFQWDDLIDLEVSRHPSINRLENEDSIEVLTEKLSPEGISAANTAFNKSMKSYTTEKARVNDLHAQLLKFFKETIEGLDNNPASTHIKNHEWHEVLPAIRQYYGNMDKPNALNGMKVKLANTGFSPDETVHQYVNKIRNLVANIQIVSEQIEERVEPLTYEEAFQACILTDEQFSEKHQGHRAVIDHLTILQKFLVDMANTRLHQVQYQWTTFPRTADQRTVVNLIKAMDTGESAMVVDDHSKLQFLAVSTVGSNGPSKNFFCAYHSYNGAKSNHDTKDCTAINAGRTKVDPKDSRYHVKKGAGTHYMEPKNNGYSNSGGDKSNKKRSYEGASTSNDNKKSGNTPKSCTKCLKYNKEGADIPETVMKTHDATNCYVQPSKYTKSGSSSNASNKAFNKLNKTVNQISTHLGLSGNTGTNSNKSKVKVNEGNNTVHEYDNNDTDN